MTLPLCHHCVFLPLFLPRVKGSTPLPFSTFGGPFSSSLEMSNFFHTHSRPAAAAVMAVSKVTGYRTKQRAARLVNIALEVRSWPRLEVSSFTKMGNGRRKLLTFVLGCLDRSAAGSILISIGGFLQRERECKMETFDLCVGWDVKR